MRSSTRRAPAKMSRANSFRRESVKGITRSSAASGRNGSNLTFISCRWAQGRLLLAGGSRKGFFRSFGKVMRSLRSSPSASSPDMAEPVCEVNETVEMVCANESRPNCNLCTLKKKNARTRAASISCPSL